jgi:hypothetical protein
LPSEIGQAYTYLALTAILPGRSEALREEIEALPLGTESPFARVEQVHFARWVIIPQLVEVGPPAPARHDKLRNEYLLFSADVDGPLDAFLDALRLQIPEVLDAVYDHCVGYPGSADAAAFRRYLRHNRIETTLPFAAYPDSTVAEVREALELRRRLIEFAVRSQQLDPASLQREFRQTFAG